MTDEPIEDPGYVHGVTVVDIGDIRVSRGMTRRPTSSCNHRRMAYDPRERRIWCKDCERDVDPFDAFVGLTEQYHYAYRNLEKRRNQVEEAEKFQCRSIAAKNIDEVWRRRKVVPSCPHCQHGLFPEDFANGVGTIGVEYARARRKAAKP